MYVNINEGRRIGVETQEKLSASEKGQGSQR
jgi:hypothetical protein